MVRSLPLFKSGTYESVEKSSADFCAFLGLGVFRFERHQNGTAKMTKGSACTQKQTFVEWLTG
jgi:hypothetical protein